MGENAQQRDPDRAGGRPTSGEAGAEPDVLLDISEVSVDSIRLAVDGLDAELSLRARLADLLQLDAGVRVHLEGVELDVSGVHAEALLKVRLEKVVAILERALTSIDRNPEILADLSPTRTAPVGEVAQRAATQGAEIAASASRRGRPAREFRARSEPEVGGATDDLGQQVGAIGVDAGEGRRPGAAPGATVGGDEAAGDRGDAPAGGRTGVPGGEPMEATGLASGSGGGGERGEAFRDAERRAAAGQDAERRAAAGQDRERPSGTARAEPATTDSRQRQQEPRPSQEPEAEEFSIGGAASSAAHLAEQAGQTLRQAGRSVWEAIQGGMAKRDG
ncbi:hypothetical protein [Micromonospora endolithica]|uniref:hypothetical protein n=1 Tax=Micromonospora endolithica TaxID=230091 RepID=UPI0011ADC9D1|nr:hypothetical protein [Micromonospora endolithica]TWJ24681.1 hypothetical protein JD76_04837 [Micromonospora endolithica]